MPRAASGGRYSTTQWVPPIDMSGIRNLDFRSEPIPDELSCLSRSILACGRQFEGPSFRHCVLGTLVTNRVLPGSVTACLNDVPMDTSGAFATGSSFNCNNFALEARYPPMLD